MRQACLHSAAAPTCVRANLTCLGLELRLMAVLTTQRSRVKRQPTPILAE